MSFFFFFLNIFCFFKLHVQIRLSAFSAEKEQLDSKKWICIQSNWSANKAGLNHSTLFFCISLQRLRSTLFFFHIWKHKFCINSPDFKCKQCLIRRSGKWFYVPQKTNVHSFQTENFSQGKGHSLHSWGEKISWRWTRMKLPLVVDQGSLKFSTMRWMQREKRGNLSFHSAPA